MGNFKMDVLTEETSEFLKLLSDPFKLKIIKYLKNGEKTSKDIEEFLDISQSYSSQLLNQLQKANIISNTREGSLKNYFIKNINIFRVISAINSFVIELHKHRFQNLVESDNIEKLK
ncbi:MAG: ArsR family transcriptional regulator [Candidatus Lokiarchaeia archaeon]|nr:ArsR family transcriptional regulator [Candidatus Lokiarchaeia archaeon]